MTVFWLANQRALNEPKIETINKCSFCDKTFACHSQVKNHEIVHSEEKPFVCEVCNRGFRRKYDKNRHVQEGFELATFFSHIQQSQKSDILEKQTFGYQLFENQKS